MTHAVPPDFHRARLLVSPEAAGVQPPGNVGSHLGAHEQGRAEASPAAGKFGSDPYVAASLLAPTAVAPPHGLSDAYPTRSCLLPGWRALLSSIHGQLKASAAACGGQGEPDADGSLYLQGQLMGCLDTLAQLRPLLEREFANMHRMERTAQEAQAAVTLIRSELAYTQDGERRARHLALHDALTALPNRRFFMEHLEQAIASLPDDGGQPRLAVIYLDLDGFKAINDAYGHEVGDELLKVVARRLDRRVRSEDLVSRLGGDEFATLRCGHVSHVELIQLARKLYETIATPIQIGALNLRVRPSIGLAVHPTDGETAQALIRNADSAMYAAKRRRSGHAFFSQDEGGRSGKNPPGPQDTSPGNCRS